MKQHIFKIITCSFLLLGVAASSCRKVIEKDTVEEVGTGNFYKTSIDAETGLFGCYNKMMSWDFYGKVLFYSDISSDDIQSYNDGGDLFRLEKRSELIPNNGEISSLWGGSYNALANINLLLEKVALIPDEKFLLNRKKEILGEARFLRAFVYWHITQFYGDVPLVLAFPKSANSTENLVARNTVAEVVTQIKADLTAAETDLPLNFNDPLRIPDLNLINSKGRATKGAAKALQLRILLWEKNWTAAAAKAQEIIAGNQYKIDGVKFVAVFRSNDGGQNTQESIMECQSVEQPGQFDNTGVLKFFYTGAPVYGATESAFANYAPGSGVDVRKEQSMFKASNPTRIYAQKYKNFYSNQPNDNYILFRYGEVLLNRAEALNEVGYPNNEVVTILNSIRARATDPTFRFGACIGIPNISLADAPTQAAMRQLIRNEKRREMTQEGLRWFDLLRWDNGSGALTATGLTSPAKLLFPIPQFDRDRNPNLTQNPGY